jgi:predicted deacylase
MLPLLSDMASTKLKSRRSVAIAAMPAMLLLAACVTIEIDVPANRFCESADLLIDRNFAGGNFHNCSLTDDGDFLLSVRPENTPINESPWYSFRVSPKRAVETEIFVHFTDGYARYWPKISSDSINWAPLPEDAVRIDEDGMSMGITLQLTQTPVWVSAQELVLPSYYDQWIRQLSAHPEITTHTLGHSVQGRPIHVVKTGPRSEAVIFLGRQHPPEISGAFAMRSFIDTVLSDTELAREFRNRYAIIIIPLMNPDGVVLGHWRHNVNGVDLNRDWGPFTQPETQSVARLLTSMEQPEVELKLMLDFHSTESSLFYTQLAEDFDEPVDFATAWLSRSRERLPNFAFKHDPRGPSGQENTKNYFFSRYGIPAITYEIGDEVDRSQIASTTPVFAEEMMRLLLQR